MEDLNKEVIEQALQLLADKMALERADPVSLVVCGGAALIGASLVKRTTRDVDVVALANIEGGLEDPEPLPDDLLVAAEQIQFDLGLPENWLNNGPSKGDGGLYRSGLPEGLLDRAQKRRYGECLTVFWVGRFDQICFKLPAAADFGGRHTEDLLRLEPASHEIEKAAAWARTYDPSDGFAWSLRNLLRALGYGTIAERI